MSKFIKLDTIGSDEIAPKALKEKEKPLPIQLDIPEYAEKEREKSIKFIDAWATSFIDKIGLFFVGLLGGIRDVYLTVEKGIEAVVNIKQILIWLAIVTGSIIVIIIMVKVLW